MKVFRLAALPGAVERDSLYFITDANPALCAAWVSGDPGNLRQIKGIGGGGGGSLAWADITGKPATFPPSAHSHVIADITGLQGALDGKQPLATVLTNTTASYTIAEQSKLAAIAFGATANATDAQLRDRSTHTGAQAQSTVTNLVADLAAKQPTLVSATNIKTINGNSVLGSGDLSVSGGATNLSYNASTRFLGSSTGTGVTLPWFDSTFPGLVPASGGGTLNFLRADGAFATPPTGGITDGDKGDITVSGAGTVWTVDPGAITLAKQADVASGTVFYRKTAAAGAPEVQTLATLKTDLGLTGTNSGDQTSIAGISGTKAQFNTAVSDGDIQFVGDAPTAHTHLLAAGATDVTITAANLNALDDGVDTALHFHAADRARANHTGTQGAATITGLATVATSGSATDLSAGVLPAARFDDAAHGARTGGTLHANVIAAGAAGFMTGADKTKLDGVATGANLYVHPNHSGDATSTGDGAITLTTVNANVGSFGSSTAVATFTVDGKGRTTAAAAVGIAIPLSQVTQSAATTGQVPQWSGSAWVPATVTGGGTVAPVTSRIRRSTNQSIATGASYTDIVYDTSGYQVNGTFWTSGATITIPENGYYQVFSEATFDGAGLVGTITANMQVLVNGSAVIGDDEKQVIVGATAALAVMAQRNFSAGDIIKVQVKHTNATAVNVLAQGDHSPDIILTKLTGAKGDPGASLTDGDKGDVIVSGSGTVWNLDPAAQFGIAIGVQYNIFPN